MLNDGGTVLHRKHVLSKCDVPTERVELVNTLSPHFARIRYSDGRVDTVSTRDLAPDANPSEVAEVKNEILSPDEPVLSEASK